MKKRMLSQDIAKELGILIVVQLHALQLSAGLFYVLAALFGFVMPFFIFMSGYNYRSKGLSPVQAMKKRVLMLLKVYAEWTAGISIVMGAYFLIHEDGTLSEILKSFAGAILSESGCKMIGWVLPLSLFQHVLAPFWYLQYLITASCIFLSHRRLHAEVACTAFLRGHPAVRCNTAVCNAGRLSPLGAPLRAASRSHYDPGCKARREQPAVQRLFHNPVDNSQQRGQPGHRRSDPVLLPFRRAAGRRSSGRFCRRA